MIRIDEEFKALIPPLAPEEFAQLEENCIRDGIRDPLVVWHVPNGDDILIDGHNRYKIASEHNINFVVEKMEFDIRDDVKAWIIRNQLGRRNLNTYNRSLLALELKPLIAERAKERQNLGLKSDEGTRTDVALGKLANVGKDTIRKVEIIERDGSDYIKEKVRSGDITINKAYLATKGINDKSPAKLKKEFMDKVKQEHEAFTESKTVSLADVKTDREHRQIIANDVYSQFLKAGSGINQFFISTTTGEVDFPEAVAEWSEDQKENARYYIRTWMQALAHIMEIIE